MVKRDGLINDSKLTSEINKLDNKIGNNVNKINKFETDIKKLQNFMLVILLVKIILVMMVYKII